MKRLIPILFLILSFLFLQCGPTAVPLEVEKAIQEVKNTFAPDKRVVTFNVKAQNSGKKIQLFGETTDPSAKQALLDKLKAFEVVDSIVVLPEAELGPLTWGVVNLSACNIRSNPKHSAELATQSTLGTILKVYKKEGDWYRVQTPDGYLGWLDLGGFVLMNESNCKEWQTASKVVFLPNFGFAYSEPNQQSLPVADLLAGNILQLIESDGTFSKVGFPDGRMGYLANADVQDYSEWLASRQPDLENILATAHQFLGRPYLWGGTSGKGVDCSGFTKSVFYLNGVLLPRDASQQVHTGIEVPTDTTLAGLLPGDLLFFGRKATEQQKEKITHVALYLGNGKVIHATGQVKIESLKRGDPDFAEDRLKTFVRAKRVLTSIGENGIGLLGESEFYTAN